MSDVSAKKVRRKLKNLKKIHQQVAFEKSNTQISNILRVEVTRQPFEIPSLGNNKESAWHLLNKSLSLKPSVLQCGFLLVSQSQCLQTHHHTKFAPVAVRTAAVLSRLPSVSRLLPERQKVMYRKTAVQVILIHEKIPQFQRLHFCFKKDISNSKQLLDNPPNVGNQCRNKVR